MIAYLHRERAGGCASLRVVDLEGRPQSLERWPQLAQAVGDPGVVESFDLGEGWAVSRADAAKCSQAEGRRLDPAFSLLASAFTGLAAKTEAPHWQGGPALSAGHLVYSSTQSGDPELWLRGPDKGAEPRRLTHAQGLDLGASFSADGQKIVWTASRPQGAEALQSWQAFIDKSLVLPLPTEVHLMRADGTGARPLTRFGAHSFAPRIDAQGWLWFTSDLHDPQRRDFDVYRSALSTPHTPTRLTHGPGFDGQAVVAADGKAIAFVSDRDGDGLALYYALLAAP